MKTNICILLKKILITSGKINKRQKFARKNKIR